MDVFGHNACSYQQLVVGLEGIVSPEKNNSISDLKSTFSSMHDVWLTEQYLFLL